MILKELNLIGFGKFENKNIKLSKGLNIIYGENEAGKSTIHSFIEGMFFGFLRPGVSSALYNKEHSKYKPWNSNRYAGIIRFEFEGQDHRIERSFSKGYEDTKVFEEVTGREISKSIETGKTRISQPGIHFFGFNTRVFSNTIFIKQLESVTDKKLANDVSEKLININTSLDGNISIEKAIADIDAILSDIGSEIAHTRPYAINIKEIEKLEKEKTKVEMEKREYEEFLEEKLKLEKEKKAEKENLLTLKDQLKKVEILEKKKILKEAEKIIEEIESLKEKKESLKEFVHISKEDYEKAIRLNENIGHWNKNIKDKKLDLEIISDKIKTFKFENIESKNKEKLNLLNGDYNYYESLESEKQKIEYKRDSSYRKVLERDIKANQDKGKKNKRNTFILVLISLFLLGAIYLTKVSTIFLFIMTGIIVILIIYYFFMQKKITRDEYKIKDELKEINNKEKLNNDRIDDINRIQVNLLKKHNLERKQEFKNLVNRFRIQAYNQDEKEKELAEIKEDKFRLEEKLKEDKTKIDRDLIVFHEILLKNNCKDLKNLSLALDNKDNYEASIKEINSKKELLEKVLSKYTLDELYKETAKFRKDIDFNMEIKQEIIIEKIEEKNNKISEINLKLVSIEEKVKILDEKVSRLVEVEEKLSMKQEHKKYLESKILALNLAKSTIKELSEEIHTEFAPNINRKLSKIVEKITSGKYNNIKISEKLEISLENPKTEEIIKIDDLSGGTIDQLYFALRFGIMDEITEKNLPLFLDDCFIQYDEKRLENVLEFLITNMKNRQILLFTCHKREKKVLEELGVNYNFINLLEV